MADKQPPVELLHTNWFSGVPRLEARSMAGPDGKSTMVIGGIAAMYGALSDPRLGFRETVERSCFNKSAGDGYPLVRCLFEHQPGIVLGAMHSKTMRISQDPDAMRYEVDMPETRSAEYESIKRGDVHASSVAFNTYQDEWRRGEGGFPVRHLVSARLDHIAPTSMPAYPDATVSLRSLAEVKEAELEEVIRDAQNNNLNRYFVRTDNIDPRNSDMTEIRSAPLVAISLGRDGGIEVTKPEEKPAAEPVVAEQKPEVKTEPPVETPEAKPEARPEANPEVKPEAKVEPAVEQKQPEPEKAVAEEKPETRSPTPEELAKGQAELDLRRRRNRLYGSRDEDPIQ